MGAKDGLTAWAAIRLLFPEPAPERSDIPTYAGGITYIDTEYDENSWPRSAVPSFQDLLQKGSWHAKGYRVPSVKREYIPSDLWDILEIDLDSNAASSRGLEYEGLRFFAAEPEVKKTKKAENDCFKWLIEEMKAERTKTEGQLHGEAEERLPGLSAKAFKRAWKSAKDQTTTHESWRTRGPIPG